MAGRFSVEAIFTAIDRMTGPIGRMEKRSLRFARNVSSSLAGADRAFGRIHSGLMRTTAALAGAGVAGGFVAKNIMSAGLDFEQAMANVAAVSLVTRDQVKDLEKEAIRLGGSTKFTAVEVANAMELMGKAGFSNAAIMKGVGGVLAAAAADGMEIADAAGVVSNAIKGMGLDVEKDAGRVADVLALASARTNSSMASLGESLSNVAATASDFGIRFEDTVAAVALLQDVGLDASVAGSALNTMLVNLSAPSDAVRAKMRRLGVSFQDAKGNMLPLRDVMGGMARAMAKSGGNMKQVALVAEMVGLRGQKAASQLAKLAKAGKFDELVRELDAAAGSAEKMAAIRMNTLLGDWETFTGAIDAVKLRLFDLKGGALRGVVQGWTMWAEANEDLIVAKAGEWLNSFQKALPGIVKDAKALGSDLATIARGVASVAKQLVEWGPGIRTTGQLVAGFYALSVATKVARGAWAVYRGALIAVTATTRGVAVANAWLRGSTIAASTASARAAAASKAYGAALDGWAGSSGKAAGGLAGLKGMINGTTSLLGKAGLLGAAAAVGFAIGSWAEKKWDIGNQIAKWLADLTGVNAELDKAGGKAKHRGNQPGGERVFADGRIEDAEGNIIKRADAPVGRPGGWRPPPRAAESAAVMGAAARSQRIVEERSSTTESRERVDVTIKDESGRAEVKGKPIGRGGLRVKLPASGRL